MTQYQQVLEALKKLGGKGTNKDICNTIDFTDWKTQYPENSVSKYLTTGADFTKEGDYWVLKLNAISQNEKDTTPEEQIREEILLHCSDGVLATAIAKQSSKKWTIF